MKRQQRRRLISIITFILISTSLKVFAQTFSVSYTPNNNTYTVGTAITSLSPTVSNGPVAPPSFGSGTQLTGATLSSPYGMGVDVSGNIYVTNFGNNTISKYNSSGTYVGTFGSAQLSNPSAISFDQLGNAYVLNYNRTNNGLGNYHGNAYVAQYSSTGTYGSTVVSGLGTATGMVADQSSNLYLAEGSYNSGNNTVAQYDISTGAGLLALSLTGTTNPIGVTVDGSGSVYVLDSLGTTSAVEKYNSAGVFQSTLITGLSKSSHAIYSDGAGDVYVGDSGAGTVTVYGPTGTQLTQITGLTDPEGMVTDSKGNLYISDRTNNTVTEYPLKGGYYINKILPAGLSFSSTTGTFSGTPTAGSPATTYTITAYSASASSSTTVTITVNSTLPVFTYDPNSVDVFTTNATITSFGPTVISGSPILSYSISGTLPTGLSFSTSTGVISGKPTTTQPLTVYTITAANAIGSSTATISIATVVADYWTGKTSSDWNTGTNWSTGNVPGSTDYASIGEQAYHPGHPFEPTISSAENVTVGYLALGATHQPTLTVTGSITVNNIFTVDNNATPTLTGTGTVNIVPSAIVDVNGAGALTINSGLTFTLQSNASGTASVDEITTGSITGNVSVQRYISAQRGYRLMASPVNAVSGVKDANGNLAYSVNYLKNSTYLTGSTGTAGLFDKTGNPTLWLYREDVIGNSLSFITGNYRGISNLSSSPTYSLNNEASNYTIPVSNGYLFYYRGSRKQETLGTATTAGAAATNDTLTTTGYLNQGQIIFRDWYNASSTAPGFSNPSISVQGFNLAANPYACTIDLDTYNSSSTTTGIYASNISKFIYELNPVTLNYDTYQATSNGTVFTNNGGRYIASGQGFFVLATSLGGQLIFNETAKIPLKQVTPPNLFMSLRAPLAVKTQANPLQMLRLEMALDTVNKDDILVIFDDNAKSGYVFNEDALYRTGSGKVSLSSLSDDNQTLAINKLPLTNGVTIPLKVGSTAYSTYTLNLKDLKGVPQLFDVWLKDAFTGDSVNMRTTPSYTFSITTDANSYGSKRFSITMRENPAMAYQLLSFNAAKTGTGRQVQVTWTTANEQNYTSFTVLRSTDAGKSYEVIGNSTSSGAGTYSLLDNAPVTGHNYYMLKQVDYNNTVTYSNIVNIEFQDNSNSSNALSIYPNPSVNTINLAIVPKSQGNTTYNIKVSNSSGMVVKLASVADTKWQDNVSSLLTGTYLIEVTDKNGSVVGQTKFVKL